MGAWGPNIFQNDDAVDIRETYRTNLLLGLSDEEAEGAIVREFGEDPNQLFWLPLAVTEWKVGRLSERVKEKALAAVEWELEHLEEFEWKGKLTEKRKQALIEARELLCSPMCQPKKLRLPWWSWKCPWPVGSVIQFRLRRPKENNPYLGHYVLLQVAGVSEPYPGRLPHDSVGFYLYNWHGETPPIECLDSILEMKPELIPLVPFRDGQERQAVALGDITKEVLREYDVRKVSTCPLNGREPRKVLVKGAGSMGFWKEFDGVIVSSLASFEAKNVNNAPFRP